MVTSAGELDRLLTIEDVTRVPDATGDPIETWTKVTTVWAKRKDIAGRERFTAQQPIAEHTALFTIRWRPGMHTRMRGLCDGEVWDFIGIAEVGGRQQWLQITAEAKP